MADGSSVSLESDFHISPNIFYFLVAHLIELIGNNDVNYKNTLKVNGGKRRATRPIHRYSYPLKLQVYFSAVSGAHVHSVVVYEPV